MFAVGFRDDYGAATLRAFGRFYNALGQHGIYFCLSGLDHFRGSFCLATNYLFNWFVSLYIDPMLR